LYFLLVEFEAWLGLGLWLGLVPLYVSHGCETNGKEYRLHHDLQAEVAQLAPLLPCRHLK